MTTIRNPIEWGGAQFVSAAHAASSFQRSIEHMQDTAHSPAPALRNTEVMLPPSMVAGSGAG